MQTSTLEQAQVAIAHEIGSDVAEFTPAGERHFLAEAALVELAGTFLLAFLKAVAKRAAAKAEDQIGDSLGDSLSQIADSLLKRLQGKIVPVSRPELEAARDEASEAAKTEKLSPEELDEISKAVTASLTKSLSDQADPSVAKRVMGTVRAEGMKAIAEAS